MEFRAKQFNRTAKTLGWALLWVIAFFLGLASESFAASTLQERALSVQINGAAVAQLNRKYPGAKIALLSAVHQAGGETFRHFQMATLNSEPRPGEARIIYTNDDGTYSEGAVNYTATLPAKIAVRRIHPGETLTSELFVEQNVNITDGIAHESWGNFFPTNDPISGLEARQTILEGQFLTLSAVQRIPTVKRGDPVRVSLITDGMVLTTQAIAQESGYTDSMLHIMTTSTKRELVGRLLADGSVEVRL